ncbi:MAG: DNA_ligase_IV_Ku-like [uncultured Corynebacteriales bacterium]|uniref:DNA ligase (ATP) n=1 Tax=uncultured Mycobacteriales bacterium TaxID=581187 RepID=A0A6J4HJ61_9ACTN|nr:MAG: DNA_ligase_IV_Ku-like [uncultured Corynebacteriales bacterium]
MQPMLATAGRLPAEPGWAYEFKWDGVRTLVETGGVGFTLTSRLGNDVTAAYPELAGMAGVAGPARDLLLDGEVVSLVDGRPSFSALQNRMHVRKSMEARRLAAVAPVTYLAFDVLRLDGADLTGLPFRRRRELLEGLGVAGAFWTTSPLFDDGPATAEAARANGLEGVVAKRLSSVYRPGARTTDWIKVRFGRRQEFVVGGWEHGEGGRAGGIGSLLLGVYEGGRLVYAGQVGTGFTGAGLRSMERRLRPSVVDRSPFAAMPPDVRGRPITWVRPELVVEVEFAEWTVEGRLRFASFQGIRTDKRPEEVVRER